MNKEYRLKKIQNYIARMPSLSTTVTKVLEICNSSRTSPNDLNQVISLDPVLTGQVLRLINSAYYSLLSQATSLTRAIIMLGINTVKNLALSRAILNTLNGKNSCGSFSMDEFWTHSICVGVTARFLATIKRIPLVEGGEYFVAGLLHDLGKIPLLNRFPEEYLQALELSKVEQIPLHQAEDEILGINHSLVGGMIAERWQLSQIIYDALSHHHNISQTRKKNHQIVTIVALANVYTNISQIGSSGEFYSDDSILNYLLDQVGVDRDALLELHESLLKEIEKAKFFLQINRKR
ncbi:MAG: HDOD domain-containing protein [Desulfobacterales bacterium]|nr:HDOD domain-containing protein [Desulfobacterales bacterium]